MPHYKKEEIRVEDYIPLVRKIASSIYKRLPDYAGVEFEDLVGVGYVGLMEAKHHFDEEKNASFGTYASIIIRGRILDYLRSLDVRTKEEKKEEINRRKTISIEEFLSDSVKEDRLSFLGTEDNNILERIEKEELVNLVAEAIDSVLNDNEKLVLSLFFKEGLKQREIADIMELTPARITQIKKTALRKVREHLKRHGI
ncbi:MAG: sigma-70 family RNA polymerase sigma factor [Desulfurobacteriaceae bacterium]